ncbi:glutamate-5-semialdehyde dehydrogenase [Rhodoblastus acidophilus]|uniref:Gamma-glutamyl phosphate reductase n=1 Tax=Candidatus Rhodoblastus alkanivorans TaxID=2954117 RepID=A0ABS9Z4C9_9HYPH|nr:glutamate-5-semialdehyde dehydrogenase [Candidatus Rhodoblastus alkanivorans]MCI4680719.1 glutamate-5-semialdehyde dehydrogenase [Candidatus Rhodoblastus alkanivorans]MCI4682326.1 glutamate-5-semialdehyde dehydrogenase [Candidatus Rhodoblastus alkanivorans]MDI4639628.1 glutamate-5-semialdehyde dehydrogenase [Rhodoblastus acidophilus]
MENLKALEGEGGDLGAIMIAIGRRARAAARVLSLAAPEQKNLALRAAAKALRDRKQALLDANALDMADARARNLGPAMLDRLALDDKRIASMAQSLDDIADLPDPVGRVLEVFERPNGLRIERVATPIGVVGVIFESRPNVTADAGALCLKAGNSAILRAGSESFHSSRLIHSCLIEGLKEAHLPEDCIALVPTRDRAAVGAMLAGLDGAIDVIVPRGGKSLVARVQAEARVPVFAHLEGIVHVYVDGEADLAKAEKILLNAKMRRTGICGAAETLLVDRAGADRLLEPLVKLLLDAQCEVRGDAAMQQVDARVKPAVEEDWSAEYLDAIIAAKLVDGVEGAIDHIETYGSHHTDCIVTENARKAEKFLREVDSAIVIHNASTQFADGGEFGFGAEIGIATGRMHARGPVGVAQLTSFKYVVHGSGQTRA